VLTRSCFSCVPVSFTAILLFSIKSIFGSLHSVVVAKQFISTAQQFDLHFNQNISVLLSFREHSVARLTNSISTALILDACLLLPTFN
jgi:hypothetical protein